MDSRTKFLLLFIVGVALVLNPVYLYPEGVPTVEKKTFEVAETNVTTPITNDDILECTGDINYRACVQALRIGYNGSEAITDLPAELGITGEMYYSWDFVRFEEGYARPTAASTEDDTVVIGFEPVDTETVIAEAATPYDVAPKVIQETVQGGTATLQTQYTDYDERDPALEANTWVVNRNGSFYHVSLSGRSESYLFPAWLLSPLVRLAAFIGGIVLAFEAARGFERATSDAR